MLIWIESSRSRRFPLSNASIVFSVISVPLDSKLYRIRLAMTASIRSNRSGRVKTSPPLRATRWTPSVPNSSKQATQRFKGRVGQRRHLVGEEAVPAPEIAAPGDGDVDGSRRGLQAVGGDRQVDIRFVGHGSPHEAAPGTDTKPGASVCKNASTSSAGLCSVPMSYFVFR